MAGPNMNELLADALAENGFEPDEIIEYDDVGQMKATICVRKQIGGEDVSFKTSISERKPLNQDLAKIVAMQARTIAQKFEEYTTSFYDIGERSFKVNPYGDDASAECVRCGKSADLPSRSPSFSQSAELSSPQPIPQSRGNRISSLDEHERLLLSMYLIGRAKKACDCISMTESFI